MEYTIKQAAEALGKGKSTIRRMVDTLPPEQISATTYRGHAAILISQEGFDRLKIMLNAPELPHESNHEANRSDSSAPTIEPSEPKGPSGSTDDMTAFLRAQIEEKDRQIASLTDALAKAQEATQAAQALHAATAEQLRLLTAHAAQEAPEPPQDAEQPERGPDTTPAEESAQEPPSAPTEAPAPEITRRATFRERLRFLFRGE